MKQTNKPSYETPVSEEFRMDVLVLNDSTVPPGGGEGGGQGGDVNW